MMWKSRTPKHEYADAASEIAVLCADSDRASCFCGTRSAVQVMLAPFGLWQRAGLSRPANGLPQPRQMGHSAD